MAGEHQKHLLQSDLLSQYILETSVYPREHDLLKQLREATKEYYKEVSGMMVPADEGQLLSMIVKMTNTKKALEIGVFTGYSLLTTALALPEDGQIVAIDMNKEAFDAVGLPFIQKAGVDHKINFVQSDALSALKKLLDEGKHESQFDFAFVDADKVNYINYHEQLMKLVKVGGVIGYDNTLWFGSVAREEEDVAERLRVGRKPIREFNRYIASDARVEISHIPTGDGLTLCRRIK